MHDLAVPPASPGVDIPALRLTGSTQTWPGNPSGRSWQRRSAPTHRDLAYDRGRRHGGRQHRQLAAARAAPARLLGWTRGLRSWGATQALLRFVAEVLTRLLYAHVAVHNVGSIRILEKCGFRRDRGQQAEAPAPDDGIEEFIFVLAP